MTRFTIADKTRQPIASKTLLTGIGLSFDRGSLIGIRNAIGRARVVRIDPEDGRVEILESNNSLFEIPTTGAVLGNDYWFIANPGLRFFNVGDPVMLKLAL